MDNIPTPTTFIYALADPSTGAIRYVGKTIKLRLRFLKHLSEARGPTPHRHCAYWIKKLMRQRLEPRMIVVCECKGNGCDEERFHISLAKYLGFRLTNLTEGGEGLAGIVVSEATRQKLRAVWKRGNRFTDEVRAKMSASAKAKIARNPDGHRATTAAGLEKAQVAARSAATKAKRLESRKSYRYPPEVRAKIAASLRGRKQPHEQAARHAAWMREMWAKKRASKRDKQPALF
jgi:hypothetical protein